MENKDMNNLFRPHNTEKGFVYTENVQGDSIGFWKDAFRRLCRKKVALVSMIIILCIVLFAIVVPIVSPYGYKDTDPMSSNLPPRVPLIEKLGILNGEVNGFNQYELHGCENAYHLFGTDELGRDIFTRTAIGTRISLLIALFAVIIDFCIGVIYGMVSGYIGGTTDIVMQRIVEIVSSIPTLVVLTLLLLIMRPGIMSIVIAMAISGWIGMSRVVRAQTLKLKSKEYVLASRTLGASKWRILREAILPNTMNQIIVTSMFSIPNAIFTEALLAFIGLGVPAPLASLGTMINDGYNSAMIYPYMVVCPVLVLVLLMLCLNLFADGLRDAVDPQMKMM